MAQLAEKIEQIEFDMPFTLTVDGDVTEEQNIHAPSILDMTPDDGTARDVLSDTSQWTAIQGLTAQHGYHGAILHPSEFIGAGIARALLDIVIAEEKPQTFVVTEVLDDGKDDTRDPIGWCILRHVEDKHSADKKTMKTAKKDA